MSIAIRCPTCNKKLSAPDEAAGKRFKCQCGAVLRVGGLPKPDAPAAEAPAPDAPPPEEEPQAEAPTPEDEPEPKTEAPPEEREPRAKAGRPFPVKTVALAAVVLIALVVGAVVVMRSRGGKDGGGPGAPGDGAATSTDTPGDAEPGTGSPAPGKKTPAVKWPVQRDENSLSPADLVADGEGKKLYIAEATAHEIAVFDVSGGKVTKTVRLPGRPEGLALSSDGTKLYVACSGPQGTVEILDADAGSKVGSLRAGHTPTAPVLSPDGSTLYVCNRFNNNVSVIDLASKKETAKIPVVREPVAAAITPDGKTLFVANHLPAGAADADYAAAVVSVIDTSAKKVAVTIQLPNGSTALKGVCVSPDGKYAYVTHILSRYQLPTTQLERGWMNTNALSIIDAPGRKLVNTVLLDDVDLGAANPWGVACTADGKSICVTHAGTHELSVIDAAALHEKLAKVAAGQKVSSVSLKQEDVPNDLSFLVGLRRRIRLKGNGPRGLAIVGKMVYVARYFSDDLAVVDLEEKSPSRRVRAIALGPKKPMSRARKGEMLFHDAIMCFQHWQSCSSCHPDGRNDGLNWDLLNDGMGNPKNTKSMLLSHATPPVMITGIRPKAEVGVRAGIKFILFAVRPEEEAVAIDEYLKAMKPMPSPYLVNGTLNEAAGRGRKAFAKAGCASCHPAPLFTDMQKYDIGTGIEMEKDRAFDTPTLVEAWRTGPYLYDGRAVTIADVLKKHNKDDNHGKTSTLNTGELEDLAAFVLSQ